MCEDSFVCLQCRALDATRTSDGRPVMLKIFFGADVTDENHAVELLDHFSVPPLCGESSVSFLVLPLLRHLYDPPMIINGELMVFVKQILEGMVFMHNVNVPHRETSVSPTY